MCDIICITNRKLCKDDFLKRIEKISKEKPLAIILREKDLSETDYKELAKRVLSICEKDGTTCILNNFANVAKKLNCGAVHLPLHILKSLSIEERTKFKIIGTSCHSVEDAHMAEKLGCTYIIAGHVFKTDCKKDLPPRGLDFLKRVCDSVDIPVYAIGGLSADNIADVRNSGAVGGCVMSGVMTTEDVKKYFYSFKEQRYEI